MMIGVVKSWLSTRLFRFRLTAISQVSLTQLILGLRGKRIWSVISEHDLPLFHPALHTEKCLFVGGHLGRMPGILLRSNPKIKLMDIYEPLPEYASQIEVALSDEILAGRVRVFREAITESGEAVEILQAGDHSAVSGIGRELGGLVNGTQSVKSVQLVKAIARLGSNYSIFMNCEGGEYSIIEQLVGLDESLLPASIVVQTHVIEPNAFSSLYLARSRLSSCFYPIIACDFAWDIWIRNDLSPVSPRDIERLPLA